MVAAAPVTMTLINAGAGSVALASTLPVKATLMIVQDDTAQVPRVPQGPQGPKGCKGR